MKSTSFYTFVFRNHDKFFVYDKRNPTSWWPKGTVRSISRLNGEYGSNSPGAKQIFATLADARVELKKIEDAEIEDAGSTVLIKIKKNSVPKDIIKIVKVTTSYSRRI